MSTPLRLVVFDVDGTLIESHTKFHEALVAAAKELGWRVPSEADTRQSIGYAASDHARALYPGICDKDAEHFWSTVLRIREAQRSTGEPVDTLFDGMREVLETLFCRPEVLLAIATNKPSRGLDYALRSHDIAHYFFASRNPDDGPAKPHPFMMEELLKVTGAEASQTVMIGDTEIDIGMARNTGTKSIGVTWGFHPEAELVAAGADRIIHQVPDIIPALQSLWDEMDAG